MACDTFIKIAQKCRRHFVQVQAGEVTPFIEEILSTISTIICDLQPQQVHTFYEAVGYMISAQNEKFVQEPLIERYMLLPNQVWDDIINQATRNVDVLKDPDAVKQLANILKVLVILFVCFVSLYNLVNTCFLFWFLDECSSMQSIGSPVRLTARSDLFGHVERLQSHVGEHQWCNCSQWRKRNQAATHQKYAFSKEGNVKTHLGLGVTFQRSRTSIGQLHPSITERGSV
jgi:hypothetical protein